MFTDKQKQIYESPLKTKHDPLSVDRRLRVASNGTLNSLLDDWESDDPIKAAIAEENLVTVSRTAFGYKPLIEPNGVSDGDTLETLIHFLEYLSFSESVDAISPTLQPATDCQG